MTGHVTACLIDRESKRAVPWPDDMRELLANGGPSAADGDRHA